MKKILFTIILTILGLLIAFGVFLFITKHSFEKTSAQYIGEHTHSYTLPFKNGTEKIPFLLTNDGDIQLKLGTKAYGGTIGLKIENSKGEIVFSEQGRKIGLIKRLRFSKGEYTAILEFSNAFPAIAVFGMSRPSDSTTNLLPIVSLDKHYEKVQPDSKSIFKWPYYIYIPDKITHSVLLVAPNNSGFTSDSLVDHEEAAKSNIQWNSKYGDKLGCPVLVPVFPRPEEDDNIYTHALDRDSILTGNEEIKRLDLQLLAMIDHARERLQKRGTRLDEKVLLTGFSASGMFSNRFALLHPERVKAAAIGSPGGWPIAPIENYEGKNLRYPIGVSDIKELTGNSANISVFKQVPLFMFIGSEDTNDSVPYEDSYEQEDSSLINIAFGTNPVERWPIAEKIYKTVGCNSTFKTYRGVGHAITPEMKEDIIEFFKQNIE